jgi:hypothetical protein
MLFQKNVDKAFRLQQQLNRERRGEPAEAEKPLEGAVEDIAEEEVPLPPQLLERQKEEKLTFKDKLAMLLSAYAVLLVPAVLILCGMCFVLWLMSHGW